MGLKKRKIACPDFSCMCVPIQLDYLNSGFCVGIKPKQDQIQALYKTVKSLWTTQRTDYFDPTWLKAERQFTQQMSATYPINIPTPLGAWESALCNIELNKEDCEWVDFVDKTTFYGVLLINDTESKEPKSHAIGVRKSSRDRYFLHDVYADSVESTAVYGYDCKEYEYKSESQFNGALTRLLTLYTAQGYSSLCVVELTPVSKPSTIKWKNFSPKGNGAPSSTF